MRSPRRVYAGLLGCCVAVAALVGCSGGGQDDEKQGRPSGSSGAESTTPDSSTLEAELGALFGPSVVPRHEGSFGLDRW
jgi:hypothetical protein